MSIVRPQLVGSSATEDTAGVLSARKAVVWKAKYLHTCIHTHTHTHVRIYIHTYRARAHTHTHTHMASRLAACAQTATVGTQIFCYQKMFLSCAMRTRGQPQAEIEERKKKGYVRLASPKPGVAHPSRTSSAHLPCVCVWCVCVAGWVRGCECVCGCSYRYKYRVAQASPSKMQIICGDQGEGRAT